MTRDAAILADILAHPDDPSPRLELADWLEETGQTRDNGYPYAGRSEWLRLNGWWQIRNATTLRWRVLFQGVSFMVGDIATATCPLCVACTRSAELRWPIRTEGQLHKEWLCWACYETGIIEGWIDSCVPRMP